MAFLLKPQAREIVIIAREYMDALILLLAGGFSIAALVCWVIILIDAFQDSIVKGILCLFCPLFGLYYALFDFDHDNKWLIIVIAFGGSAIARGLILAAH